VGGRGTIPSLALGSFAAVATRNSAAVRSVKVCGHRSILQASAAGDPPRIKHFGQRAMGILCADHRQLSP
jgi:hypothetical protein